MKKFLYLLFVLLLLAGSFAVGSWYSHRQTRDDSPAARRVLYFVDQMNPAHTSDKPGLAPCGMNMEPVYADEAESGPTGGPALPGTVRLNLQKQQLIGIRTGTAEKKSLGHTIRLLGKVEPDATR